MKKFIIFCIGIFAVLSAYAAQIVNVEYIHNAIQDKWDISLAYNSELSEPRVAANMKYLLTAVDVANQVINGAAITDYGNGEYATMVAADTVATDAAVDELIRIDGFYIKTTSDTTSFSFQMYAAGDFTIDWGDGNVETINSTSTALAKYSHTYDTAKSYIIRLGGRATAYHSWGEYAAIQLYNGTPANVAKIGGRLSDVFPTLDDGTNPSFDKFCYNCTNWTGSIPAELFRGYTGTNHPIYMFAQVFHNCTGLTGSIPDDLFADISGAPTQGMFEDTFRGASGLTGSIPENLFAGIKGDLQSFTFNMTFMNCSGLTGSIPGNLFAGITGAPTSAGFNGTFAGCKSLSGTIPGNLFAGISGAPAETCFGNLFDRCYKITGPIPGELFAGVKGAPAVQMFHSTFKEMYALNGEIPGELFAGISGAPASDMFNQTFYLTRSLTGEIPGELFAGIQGEPAPYMFRYTFNATGLTGIGKGLFDGIVGAPAEGMFMNALSESKFTSIPDGLFAGISGAPAPYMFHGVFEYNFNLKTVPADLFAGISGAPAQNMYAWAFHSTGLTEIPLGLLGDISGDAATNMFAGTFRHRSTSSLTGPSARAPDGRYLYEIWPDATDAQVANMYENATGLDDYADIPEVWK